MRESQNFTRECFVLRLDISWFFIRIDKSILFNQIILGISKKKWKEFLDKDLANFLIQKIVFQNPLENTHYKSPKNGQLTELEESYLGLFSHFDAYKLSQKIIFKHKIQGETP